MSSVRVAVLLALRPARLSRRDGRWRVEVRSHAATTSCAAANISPGPPTAAAATRRTRPSPSRAAIACRRRSATSSPPTSRRIAPHGIGDWSEDEFVARRAVGLAPDGSHLYPAMPYDSYTPMSRDDVLAIRAFLMTQRPIDASRLPATMLAFPFDQRWLLCGLEAFELSRCALPPRRRQERGMEPRRLSRRGARPLRHLPHAAHLDDGHAIVPGPSPAARSGHGRPTTSPSDPVAGSAAGASSDHGALSVDRRGAGGSPMPRVPWREAVEHGLRYLSQDDIQAIAVYLRETSRDAGRGASTRRVSTWAPSPAETAFRGTATDQRSRGRSRRRTL